MFKNPITRMGTRASSSFGSLRDTHVGAGSPHHPVPRIGRMNNEGFHAPSRITPHCCNRDAAAAHVFPAPASAVCGSAERTYIAPPGVSWHSHQLCSDALQSGDLT